MQYVLDSELNVLVFPLAIKIGPDAFKVRTVILMYTLELDII
jgi:hypothetical protein